MQALALMELHQLRPEPRLRPRICAVCDALVASGPGYVRGRRGRSAVALWGYHQVQAVAQAARLFAHRPRARDAVAGPPGRTHHGGVQLGGERRGRPGGAGASRCYGGLEPVQVFTRGSVKNSPVGTLTATTCCGPRRTTALAPH
jgi:hypothetical protein